jgi:hypothetical protein
LAWGASSKPCFYTPLPPRSGGVGSGVGGASADSVPEREREFAEPPPTPDPSPPRASRAGGGEEEASSRFVTTSRFATSSLVPRVDARARCAAASPPERRSQELSGGGCSPVDEPRPLSPRLIAGLSSSASAGPIGCTSGLDALEFGAFDFGVFRGFFGWSGFFAIRRIWDESEGDKRAKAHRGNADERSSQALIISVAFGAFARHCQQMSAR